jgi:hypothetical protein
MACSQCGLQRRMVVEAQVAAEPDQRGGHTKSVRGERRWFETDGLDLRSRSILLTLIGQVRWRSRQSRAPRTVCFEARSQVSLPDMQSISREADAPRNRIASSRGWHRPQQRFSSAVRRAHSR